MITFILIILYNSMIITSDYCGPDICNGSQLHTLCKYYVVGPGKDCVGYVRVPLASSEKVRLLDRLNQRRNDVSCGRLRNFPPAINMLKMRWVEVLEEMAQRWADQCRPPAVPEEHDICRNLFAIEVGQCVASLVGDTPGLRVESFIDTWYIQSLNYNGNITSYALSNENRNYNDFAQMIWANSYMVGCGRSRFRFMWRGHLRTVERLVCNFAPRGPPPGGALWMPGPAGMGCPTESKQDNQYPYLCVNNITAKPIVDDYNITNSVDKKEIIEVHKNTSHVVKLNISFTTSYPVEKLENKLKIMKQVLKYERVTKTPTLITKVRRELRRSPVATMRRKYTNIKANSSHTQNKYHKHPPKNASNKDFTPNFTENVINSNSTINAMMKYIPYLHSYASTTVMQNDFIIFYWIFNCIF